METNYNTIALIIYSIQNMIHMWRKLGNRKLKPALQGIEQPIKKT